MTTQSHKHTLGLSGEFLVAGELLRRGLHASVTYGNAKKADVVILSKSRRNAVVLEVKTTSQDSWVIGSALPKQDDDIWVFVHLPKLEKEPPRYFLLKSSELHSIVAAEYEGYCERYRKRNGCEFSGNPVHNLSLKQAMPFEGMWQKVLEREI